MQLYDFPRSSASFRVRMAAALKGVQLEQVLVNFRENEQQSNEFKQISPSGLVPVLREGDFALTQSLAIIRYLDRLSEQNPLFPSTHLDEAIVLEMTYGIACDIHPLNNLRVMNYLKTQGGLTEEQVTKEWYPHWILTGFDAVEQRIKQYGGQFAFGDTVTVADICIVPQVFNARRFDVELSEFPCITSLVDRLEKIPEVLNAYPDKQTYK